MAEKGKYTISHFLVIGGGTALNLFIGLLTTPVITRIVDPTQYGQWSIFTMYASIGLMIFCLGLDQAFVRFFYKYDDEKYKRDLIFTCWKYPLTISVIASFIIILLSGAHIIHFEFDTRIVVLLCIHVIILMFNRFGQLVLRVTYKSGLYSLTTIFQKVVYVLLVLVAIKTINEDYFTIMVLATMASYIVPAVIAICSQRKLWIPELPVDKSRIHSKEIITFGLPFILSLGITTVFQSIDKMSLNHYCSYTEVGVYSSAMTLVHIFAVLQTTFNTLWTPMATEHYEKNPNEKTFYVRGNQIISVLMFSLGISLILVKDIFALLLGSKYREAAYILPFLIFNPIMYTISESTCMGIGFSKKTKMNIVVAVGACLTNIVGNTILVPIYGGRGAAISTGISYIVFWLLRTVISNRYYYINFNLTKFAIITALCVVYAWYNTFYEFGIISVVGYVVCLGFIIALYKQTILDMLRTGAIYVKQVFRKIRA